MDIKKLGIIGCGNVGATIAYTVMESGLFSEMVLIDVDKKRAVGEEMDMNHCLPFLSPMKIYAGDYDSLSDASIIVIAAGAGQLEGETRLDLVYKNNTIFKSIIEKITEVNHDCIILVVTNPVDILTYQTLRFSGFDASRVIGSGTVLDTARLKFLMGKKLSVDSRNIHAFIIGEHGDSELAVWSGANVSGIDLENYCFNGECPSGINDLHGIYDQVKNSAYEIIRGKGATYYAIAQATLRILRSIVKDENSILTVSTLADGHYGMSGLCISVPAVVGKSGVKHVLDIALSKDENELLQKSANTIKSVIAELGDESLAPA
jgi:L-lactate dehydrogenase